jgi:UDP-N-acetylglucosamine 2-epimerase (non-hydrolysing)
VSDAEPPERPEPAGDPAATTSPKTPKPTVIGFVVGTRPEAIKMAPVIARVDAEPQLRSFVISTGQHREMLQQAFEPFGLVPDLDLDLMEPGQSPSTILANAIARLAAILSTTPMDYLVVQGDTTTALAGALAGAYAQVPIVHVEAGLRTGNPREPFPEEINRRTIGAVADIHFPPTPGSAQNLAVEGVCPDKMLVSGNTVIDALLHVAAQDRRPPQETGLAAVVNAARAAGTKVVAITAHRRENFGAPFREACEALREVADALGDSVQLVWPVHPNPNVGPVVREAMAGASNVLLCDPLDYQDLVWLLRHVDLVITDSGGIQEEAPALGVPVLVLRAVTERPEAVEFGVVRLVGCDRPRIVEAAIELLTDDAAHAEMANAINPYGDGRAADRIVRYLLGEDVEPFDPQIST